MARNSPTAERAVSAGGIVLSVAVTVAFHLGLFVILFLSFSKRIDIPLDGVPIVPVDLVTLADSTNVAPTVKADNTPPDVKEQAPPPTPEVAPPKIDIAPEAKPKPKPQSDAEKFDINDIEKLLSRKKPANAKVAQRTVEAVGAGTAMTADLASLLQSLIYRCWSPPVGSPHPERLIVRYELFLNRDGSVARAPQLTPESAAAVASDPYMAAAAGAARRAIYTCAPYRLPADKYVYWRDVIFTFDPRQFGQ
jgi:outer membrane biosynthesis protein TonB